MTTRIHVPSSGARRIDRTAHLRLAAAIGGLLLAASVASPLHAGQVVPPDLTRTVVDAGPGNQTDPHVDGDLVSYTSALNGNSQIGYFNLATGVSTFTPGTATSLDFLLGLSYGTTVVSEIVVYDRSSATSTRLTDDLAYDRSPAVAPNGAVIVWERIRDVAAHQRRPRSLRRDPDGQHHRRGHLLATGRRRSRKPASGNSGLHYDTASNQFVYNWATSKAMAGNCYGFLLRLDDGSEYAAYFRLQ